MRDEKSFFTDDVLYCLLLREQKDFDYVRLNSQLKPSEMCGVVLGVRCSLGESDKLNWTINIPDKKSNQFDDSVSKKRLREELPSASPSNASFSSSFSSSKGKEIKNSRRQQMEGNDHRDPWHAFLSDMNTEKWMKRRERQALNNQEVQKQESQDQNKKGRLVDWTGSVPSSSSFRKTWKDRESSKDQRTRIHNEFGDELQDHHETYEDEEDTRRISRIPAIQGTMKTEWNNKNSMENERNHITDKNKMKDGGVNSPKNNDDTGLKKKPLKFLQITDIHLDPYFKTGSRTDCGEPVCCRSDSGRVGTMSSMAGVCGEYMECDTPYFTVENTLKRIRSSHPDIDLWLMTGDLLPHDIWEYNRNDTLAQLRFTTGLINQYSRDTPVLPLIGNHEAVPVNR